MLFPPLFSVIGQKTHYLSVWKDWFFFLSHFLFALGLASSQPANIISSTHLSKFENWACRVFFSFSLFFYYFSFFSVLFALVWQIAVALLDYACAPPSVEKQGNWELDWTHQLQQKVRSPRISSQSPVCLRLLAVFISSLPSSCFLRSPLVCFPPSLPLSLECVGAGSRYTAGAH